MKNEVWILKKRPRGELAEGDERAFGFPLPRDMIVKARMKDVLRAHGLPVAKHALARDSYEGLRFADYCSLPIVVKPPAGAGGKQTFRVATRDELEKALREALQEAGLRDQVKVVIGGAPASPDWAQTIGADAYAAGHRHRRDDHGFWRHQHLADPDRSVDRGSAVRHQEAA